MPRSTIDVKYVSGTKTWTVDTPFRQQNRRANTKKQAITEAKNAARPGDRLLIFKQDGDLDRMIEVDDDVNSNQPFGGNIPGL